jgi:hypothetical protein
VLRKHIHWIRIQIQDFYIVTVPNPRSDAFLTPGTGIRDGKNPHPGSGTNIPDHFSESLETIFGVKNIKIL